MKRWLGTGLALGAALLAILVIVSADGEAPPARAHTAAGPEIIDSVAICNAHNMDAEGDDINEQAPAADVPTEPCNDDNDPDALEAGEFETDVDAVPMIDLDGDGAMDPGEVGLPQFDLDSDGVRETVVAPLNRVVQIVVHFHTGSAHAANGTMVNGSLSASAARIVRWSLEGGNGLDGNNDGVDDGALFDGVDALTVLAETVGDADGAADGLCSAANDTCIDNVGANVADGIAIFRVNSSVPQDVTFTVTFVGLSDSIRVIWSGTPASVTVASNETVIANGPAALLGGDPDALITVIARDGAGQAVPGVNVDCRFAPTNLADMLVAAADNGAAAAGVDLAFDDVSDGAGQVLMSLEAVLADASATGTVVVICWGDSVVENDALEEGEASAYVMVRVGGSPATVGISASPQMDPGSSQTFTVAVNDADDSPVADGTACAWTSVGVPAGAVRFVNAATATGVGAATGITVNTLLVGSASGAVSTAVVCGGVSATFTVQVGPTPAPTPTPTPTPAPLGLVAGLNFVPAAKGGALPGALTNCQAATQAVFWFNAAAQTWAWHFPGVPAGVNTLEALTVGQVYVLLMGTPCAWRP